MVEVFREVGVIKDVFVPEEGLVMAEGISHDQSGGVDDLTPGSAVRK